MKQTVTNIAEIKIQKYSLLLTKKKYTTTWRRQCKGDNSIQEKVTNIAYIKYENTVSR